MLEFHVLTLFPEIFPPVLSSSMTGIAQEKNLVRVELHNFRDYSADKHKKVDDTPYGGGPGMVIRVEPVFAAAEAVGAGLLPTARKIILSPTGKTFNQAMARELAKEQQIVLLCGHYEGFDQRIMDGLGYEAVSVGDFVTSGGEIPAMLIMDAVIRLVPGVLGDYESTKVESFEEGLLDFPQYTRPVEFRGMRVPEVLLSGHHAEIEKWRRQQALERTRKLRKDLLDKK